MTNNIPLLRKIAAILALVVILLVIYLGAYLPFRKAKLFIQTMRSLASAQTLEEVGVKLDGLFDFYSPVGTEEYLKFLIQDFAAIVRSSPSPEVAKFLTDYLEWRFNEYLAGEGAGGTKQLVQLGNLVAAYALREGDGERLAAAERYYLQGLALSPRRPELLLALYNLYSAVGRQAEAEAISQEILTYWPNIKIVP